MKLIVQALLGIAVVSAADPTEGTDCTADANVCLKGEATEEQTLTCGYKWNSFETVKDAEGVDTQVEVMEPTTEAKKTCMLCAECTTAPFDFKTKCDQPYNCLNKLVDTCPDAPDGCPEDEACAYNSKFVQFFDSPEVKSKEQSQECTPCEKCVEETNPKGELIRCNNVANCKKTIEQCPEIEYEESDTTAGAAKDATVTKKKKLCPDMKTTGSEDESPVKHECGRFESIKGLKQEKCIPKQLCFQTNFGLKIECFDRKYHASRVEKDIDNKASTLCLQAVTIIALAYQMI